VHGRALLVAGILLALLSGPSHAQLEEGAAGAEPTRKPEAARPLVLRSGLQLCVPRRSVYFGSGGAIRVLRIEKGVSRELTSTFTPGVVRQLVVSEITSTWRTRAALCGFSTSRIPTDPSRSDAPSSREGFVSVVVQGKYAYTANGWSGLGVVDVSNPESPRPIGMTKAGRYATDVHVRGSLAYLAANQGGIRIFDVSKPEAPREWGTWTSSARRSESPPLAVRVCGLSRGEHRGRGALGRRCLLTRRLRA
jgi:hypothetical protein